MSFRKALFPALLSLSLPFSEARAEDPDAVATAPAPLSMVEIEQAWGREDYVSARAGLKHLAETEGTALAQYRYGRILLEGRGGPRDVPEARAWLEKAVAQNHLEATVLLARLYLSHQGEGADRTRARALQLFKSAAARGMHDAQFYLAQLLRENTDNTDDLAEALTWLLAAAEGDHLEAQFLLSRAYSRGEGVEADNDKAVHWLRRAAEEGHAEAQFFYAYALDSGRGVPRDRKTALSVLRRSAEAGYVRAQTALGRKYLNGDGVAADVEEGMRWLRAASEAGDMDALTDVAEAFLNHEAVPPNPALALSLFNQAAQTEFPRAMIGLADMLAEGLGGVEADIEQAVKLYRRAEGLGDGSAVLRLGALAGAGRLDGVLAPERAVPWAMAAAAQGDARALDWVRARAEEGMRLATTEIAIWDLEKEDAGEETVEEAARLLTRSAEEGDTRAQHRLGLLYVKGRGVAQDYKLAYKWLNISGASGSSEALKMRDVVSDLMTAEEIAEAQRATRQFFDAARAPVETGN